jgi:hypothetical protein
MDLRPYCVRLQKLTWKVDPPRLDVLVRWLAADLHGFEWEAFREYLQERGARMRLAEEPETLTVYEVRCPDPARRMPPLLVLDFRGVAHLSNADVGNLLMLCGRADVASGRIAVCNLSDAVATQLQTTQADIPFQVFPDAESALRDARQRAEAALREAQQPSVGGDAEAAETWRSVPATGGSAEIQKQANRAGSEAAETSRVESAGGTAGSQPRTFHCPVAKYRGLIESVRGWLLGEGYKCQVHPADDGSTLLQVEKPAPWWMILGSSAVMKILFRWSNDVVTIDIGGCGWLDKAVGGGASMLPVVGPGVLAALWGLRPDIEKQLLSALPDRVYEHVANYLRQLP